LWTEQHAGRSLNRCVSIRADGSVEAAAAAVTGDGSWLAAIHATAAVGPLLFSATDLGVVRVEVDGARLVAARTFPETEPFVDSTCHLLPVPEGLYVVDRGEVRLLRMAA
jgi:H/ACA ribonucleoprotein complex subunit 3